MAALYANENFPFPVVEELRRLGHRAVTVQETGKGDQATSDAEVLEFARANGLCVLTINRRHFIRLHRESANHAGIIACTFDPDFESQARHIHDIIEAEAPLEGKLLRVNRGPA